MKLYSMAGACSLVDHIALQWSGLDFEVEMVTRAQIKEPEFLKINPVGSVPALVDGDLVITQNLAILYYICAKAPNSGINGGSDLAVQTQVYRWLSLLNSDVHPTFKPLFGAWAYLGETAEAQAKEQAIVRLRQLYTLVGNQLVGHDWIAHTKKPTMADAYAFVTLSWAKKLQVDLSDIPNLASFTERFAQDDGVQKALKAEGLI